MTAPWIAALFAIFVWWLSTGVILLVVRRADRDGGHRALVMAGVPFLVIGVAMVAGSLHTRDVAGVYQGFLGALAIWGWIELMFLAGVITGPMRDAALPGAAGRARFMRAFAALAYHELLLLAGLFGLAVATDGAANRMALATYMVLFLARICAKLNLFYGVPRINTEFMPARLSHLKSYFTQGPVTLAFPIAITILTALLAVCLLRLWLAETETMHVAYALLSALTALALLEHWLMVVPLPDAKLWRWMLPAPRHDDDKKKDLRHGF